MWSSETSTLLSTSSIFFHWYYIPGWCLISSMTFRHSCLALTLILQDLHPVHAISSSNSSHHLKFVLSLILCPFPPGLVQKAFFAGSLSSNLFICPAQLSLISSSLNLRTGRPPTGVMIPGAV